MSIVYFLEFNYILLIIRGYNFNVYEYLHCGNATLSKGSECSLHRCI